MLRFRKRGYLVKCSDGIGGFCSQYCVDRATVRQHGYIIDPMVFARYIGERYVDIAFDQTYAARNSFTESLDCEPPPSNMPGRMNLIIEIVDINSKEDVGVTRVTQEAQTELPAISRSNFILLEHYGASAGVLTLQAASVLT